MDRTNFEDRRQSLAGLSNEELNRRFWELTTQTVSPLLALAKRNTTPSIERSVLLRMGFSSLEAKAIVEAVINHNLMGKGAGHVVYKFAKARNIDIRKAGHALIEGKGWEEVSALFAERASR